MTLRPDLLDHGKQKGGRQSKQKHPVTACAAPHRGHYAPGIFLRVGIIAVVDDLGRRKTLIGPLPRSGTAPISAIRRSQANLQHYFGLGVAVPSCWFKAPASVFGVSLGVGEGEATAV